MRQVAGRDALKGYYLTGSKPASSPTKPLPPSPNPQSYQPVVLFRDTNAWCPFCQKVWMALLEKGIPFDSVLIDLQNKPDWYSQVLESKMTPAMRINGEIVGESVDIMLVRGCKMSLVSVHSMHQRRTCRDSQRRSLDEQSGHKDTQWWRTSGGVRVSAAEPALQELEKQFVDSPALLPADKEDEIRAFMKTWEAKSRSAVSLTFAASPPTDEQKPLVEALAEYLDEMGGASESSWWTTPVWSLLARRCHRGAFPPGPAERRD